MREKSKSLKMNGAYRKEDVILVEKYGSIGTENTYIKNETQMISLQRQHLGFPKNMLNGISGAFKSVFLPYGYPDSVSDDYLDYQLWDTVQAFCSTITGTFTTQAILKGVGVGSETATPLAAVITWVLKDGTGMVGRIVFAWWKGNVLDADCKQWRLFADILNDTALIIEFLLPLLQNITVEVLCVTSVLKSIVGVAGGATRASITQHQAIRGNMADVSAKDASQETCVNLIASFIGIFLLTLFENQIHMQWLIFLFSTFIHILANYYAVSSLIFKHVNETRLLLVLRTYLKYDTVANPVIVNQKESLVIGRKPNAKSFCGYKIVIGTSLKEVLRKGDLSTVQDILDAFADREYIIVPDLKKSILYISLHPNIEPRDVITAYFHAVMMALALCHFNRIELNFNVKRQLHHVTPLQRLDNLMKSFPKNNALQPFIFPVEKLISFQEFVNTELSGFFTALSVNGWDMSHHSLQVGEWRCNYNAYKSKKKD